MAWFSDDYMRYGANYFLEYYIPKRLEKKIWARTIFPDIASMREFAKNDEKQLRQSKFISSKKFQIHIEIILYGQSKIGLIAYDEELAIIIESQKIFEALKSFFEVMWEMTQ